MLFHLSTPRGEGGLAVFELFEADADAVVEQVFRGSSTPVSGQARLGVLIDGGGEPIDEVVISRQPASSMWCGLQAWTVSVHGGVWIQQRVAELFENLGGRRVERREVLELAVSSGALDPIQAAAFELLVEARTERAAAFFWRMFRGELSRKIERLRDAARSVEELRRGLGGLLRASQRVLRLGLPLKLLIAGRPNTGKSTLFNRLVETERVTVSARAGTTRDIIRETISVDGFPVEVGDGAGLRERGEDPVETEAIRRVRDERADAVVYLLAPPWSLDEEARGFLGRFAADRRLVVGNFLDQSDPGTPKSVDATISALRGDGVEELKRLIARRFLDTEGSFAEAPFTERQIEGLESALRSFGSDASTAALDECRRLLIMGVRSSWP